MQIRPYQPADDPALMVIEYRSPRGAAAPFVHYRRRFADRVSLFQDAMLFVLDIDDVPQGCIAVALKQVQISHQPFIIGYIFDLRVSPELRRHGYGEKLIQFVEDFVQSRGGAGVYGDIVSTNLPSLTLFEKIGYTRIRQLLYLEYEPVPACPPGAPVEMDHEDDWVRFSPLSEYDFYVEGIHDSVLPYAYTRWYHDSDRGFASLSAFDISQIYRQIQVEDLMIPHEILAERSRSIRLFNVQGTEAPELNQQVFDTVRYAAQEAGYYNLSMVVDAEQPLPFHFFEQAVQQKRYWMTFKPLHPDFQPEWSSPFYIDPREL